MTHLAFLVGDGLAHVEDPAVVGHVGVVAEGAALAREDLPDAAADERHGVGGQLVGHAGGGGGDEAQEGGGGEDLHGGGGRMGGGGRLWGGRGGEALARGRQEAGGGRSWPDVIAARGGGASACIPGASEDGVLDWCS